jgi:hypothetical protein
MYWIEQMETTYGMHSEYLIMDIKTLSIRHNRVYGSYPRGIEYIWEWQIRLKRTLQMKLQESEGLKTALGEKRDASMNVVFEVRCT